MSDAQHALYRGIASTLEDMVSMRKNDGKKPTRKLTPLKFQIRLSSSLVVYDGSSRQKTMVGKWLMWFLSVVPLLWAMLSLTQLGGLFRNSAATFLLSTQRTTTPTGSTIAMATTTTTTTPSSLGEFVRGPNSSSHQRLNIVILVHGWMGNPDEMKYLQESLQRQSKDTMIFVHSAVANNGQTMDGIAKGGVRLADEVNAILKQVADRRVSLSFVGNSMGGLYARYALAHLDLNEESTRLGVFCTTATPHLGVSQHTYLPLPRFAESVIATIMQPTGQDLFRFTDVIEQLTVQSEYTKPLQSFQKRVAYANAFATDFQVPTATAAFLARDSDSPHHRIENRQQFVSLKVETPQRPIRMPTVSPLSSRDLAERLDAMGWHKIFCDVRDTLVSVPWPWFGASTSDRITDQQQVLTSHQLLQELAGSSNKWTLPLGHTMMVANSKNWIYSKINAGGRPIMDELARQLIQDMGDNESS